METSIYFKQELIGKSIESCNAKSTDKCIRHLWNSLPKICCVLKIAKIIFTSAMIMFKNLSHYQANKIKYVFVIVFVLRFQIFQSVRPDGAKFRQLGYFLSCWANFILQNSPKILATFWASFQNRSNSFIFMKYKIFDTRRNTYIFGPNRQISWQVTF